jgi:hypothetical protein
MSTQRLNIYLRDGSSTATTALLPGTNTSASGAWTHAIVADGRYATSRFGGGVYDADLQRAGDVTLDVDPAGKIIASVPASTLNGIDLSNAGYQVSMYSDAEDGEGIGNIRPVYSAECAQGINCPSFVGPYRVGGGAGEWTDALESRDTNTTDSNALDIISGDIAQATVMDWTRGPVVVPYVHLDSADTVAPTVTSVTLAKRNRVVIEAADERSGVARIEYSTQKKNQAASPWTQYTGPFKVDMASIISIRVIDNAGNVSDVTKVNPKDLR